MHVDSKGSKYLCYTEDISKNRKITPKCVRAYKNKVNPERCIVRLYEKYLSHRPTAENCSTAYYLRPLVKPIGIHTLSGTVARLCNQADLPGFRTNHYLRATTASRLYDHGFDEQLVCETTGHRSSAVRAYKRTSDGQKKNISCALYAATPSEAQVEDNKPSCSTNIKDGGVHITLNIKLDK